MSRSDQWRAELGASFGEQMEHQEPNPVLPRGAQEPEPDTSFFRTEYAEGFDFLDGAVAPTRLPADEWPAFRDVDTKAARVRKARIDAEAARIAAVDSQRSRPPEARAARRFIGGLFVLVLAAGAAFSVASHNASLAIVEAPIAEIPATPDHLACFGAFHRTLDVGISAKDVDEQISEVSFLYASGAAELGSTHVGSDTGGEGGGLVKVENAEGAYQAAAAGTTIAGASVHRAAAGDLRGLATAACVRPSMEQFLVGSQTSVGTSNELILVNSGQVPAAVHLDAYGSAGELTVSSMDRIVVGVGQTKRVALDGIVDSDTRVAFRVATESGTVAATIQETVLDGARPAGTTFIPSSTAATAHVVTGVYIGADALSVPLVRIANLNGEETTATVRLLGTDGVREVEGLAGLAIGAHSVLDVPLAGIDAGIYSVVVEAAAPVAAGVQLSRQEAQNAPRDIAWAAPVAASASGVAIVGDATAMLAVSAEEAATVQIVPLDVHGARLAAVSMEVGALSTQVVDIPSDAVAFTLEADVPVYAAVALEAPLDEGIAADWTGLTLPADVSAARRIIVR